MKRRGILGILLALLSLSLTWHTGTSPVLGARAQPGTAFAPQSALVQSISGGWIITDFSQYEGLYTSIAVDSNGLVHISHVNNGDLMYTRQYRVGDGVWWATTMVVAADNIQDTSLTLDENDRPYITYYNPATANLCWAWSPTDGVWNTDTRNTPGVADGADSSAVMRGGVLHVTYRVLAPNNVEYIEIIPGGGWPPTPQTVGGSIAPYSGLSLALRSDGLPRISYATDSGRLMYARYNGPAWTLEEVDGGPEHQMGHVSLALTADNRPRIAYVDRTNRDLRYVAYLLIGWGVPTVVDDTLGDGNYSYFVSLAVDAAGNSHIAYYDDYGDDVLRYARNYSGSSWSFETVDWPAIACGTASALALDSLGRPHVSYWRGHLRYAYRAFTVYLPAIMRGQ